MTLKNVQHGEKNRELVLPLREGAYSKGVGNHVLCALWYGKHWENVWRTVCHRPRANLFVWEVKFPTQIFHAIEHF